MVHTDVETNSVRWNEKVDGGKKDKSPPSTSSRGRVKKVTEIPHPGTRAIVLCSERVQGLQVADGIFWTLSRDL